VLFKEDLLPAITEVFNENSFRTISENKIKRYSDCGKYLQIDPETGEIIRANFCKMRLCPVCNYIKSSINFYKIRECVQHIKKENNANFIFLTLTVANCEPENLSETITHVLKSFNRLRSRKTWQDSILGVIRGLEITYNNKNNTFHPHIHMLAAVPEDYFYSNNKNYITIEKLRNWWKESANLNYHVQVDIRKVDSSDNAIAEVAKYSIKMAEVLQAKSDENQIEATKTINNSVHGRRLIGALGVFKKSLKELKIKDLDELNLETLEQNHEKITELIWDNTEKNYGRNDLK
jgi:plasmid rolling circle replication initiator protein Rep